MSKFSYQVQNINMKKKKKIRRISIYVHDYSSIFVIFNTCTGLQQLAIYSKLKKEHNNIINITLNIILQTLLLVNWAEQQAFHSLENF